MADGGPALDGYGEIEDIDQAFGGAADWRTQKDERLRSLRALMSTPPGGRAPAPAYGRPMAVTPPGTRPADVPPSTPSIEIVEAGAAKDPGARAEPEPGLLQAPPGTPPDCDIIGFDNEVETVVTGKVDEAPTRPAPWAIQVHDGDSKDSEVSSVDSSWSQRNAVLMASRRVTRAYSATLVKCPCCMMILYFIVLLALLGILYRPFDIDFDFGAFVKADGDAARHRDAYLTAFDNKKGYDRRRLESSGDGSLNAGTGARSYLFEGEHIEVGPDDRRLQGTTLETTKTLTFIYAANSGNALDERALRDIRDIEVKARSLPGWRRICARTVGRPPTGSSGCDTGSSLAAVAWPSLVNVSGLSHEYLFDGRGDQMLAQPVLLSYLQMGQEEESPLAWQRFFPKRWEAPVVLGGNASVETSSHVLRSQYQFRMPLGPLTMTGAEIRAALATAKVDYRLFIADDFWPWVSDRAAMAEEYQHVTLYYSGDEISGHEMLQVLLADVMFCFGSVLFVTLYTWLHTRDLVLSICSIFVIFASIPVGFVLTPASKTTVAFFLSLFLIIGIGCDNVFVFIDFWTQSRYECTKREDRVSFTLMHAGKACLATSTTTSVSFFANLSSVLQPLREFGFFMGMCVMGAFVLVFLFVPALLLVREGCGSKRVSPDDDDILSCSAVVPQPNPSGRESPTTTVRLNAAMHERTGARGALFNFTSLVARWKGVILVSTFVVFVSFAVGVGLNAELDQGMPKIFPDDHNQAEGVRLVDLFDQQESFIKVLPESANACPINASTTTECDFHWCEVRDEIMGYSDGSTGSCWRSPTFLVRADPPDPTEPEPFENVDGGANRSCGGALVNASYEEQYPADSLTACQDLCLSPPENFTAPCVGLDYDAVNATCALWTQVSGVQSSIEAENHTCLRTVVPPPMPLGTYVVTRSGGLYVFEDLEGVVRASAYNGAVAGDATVEIVEVVTTEDGTRIRGRMPSPNHGWMTLNNLVTGTVYVELRTGTSTGERPANSWELPSLGFGPSPCTEVTVKARVSGVEEVWGSEVPVIHQEWRQAWTNVVAAIAGTSFGSEVTLAPSRGGRLGPLALERWETGSTLMSDYFDLGVARIADPLGALAGACEIEAVCYAGTRACNAPGWTRVAAPLDLPSGPINLRRLQDEPRGEPVEQPQAAFIPAPPGSHLDGPPSTPLGRELELAPWTSRAPELQLAPGRALQQDLVPLADRIDVSVAFGLLPATHTPLMGAPDQFWTYDPKFEPQNPWAQRAMLRMCTDMPENLMIVQSRCWIQDFRFVEISNDRRFPSREFDDRIRTWFEDIRTASWDMWIVDDKVVAAQMRFFADVHKERPARLQLDFKEVWDNYIDGRNAEAPQTANRAFHTAQAWVRAEAEVSIVSSTVETILVSACCGFLGMLVFTGSLTLAFLVLVLVLGVITGLAFFIVCIMGWLIGPIEVIALVVFLGYSVTYSLHVAHGFSEVDSGDVRLLPLLRRQAGTNGRPPGSPKGWLATSELVATFPPAQVRLARTRLAVMRVGAAILSSGFSTLGCSFFLLLGVMRIFAKLGGVVITVTVLSIISSLVVLPAAMILFGPPLEPWYTPYLKLIRKRLQGNKAQGDEQVSKPLLPPTG